MASPASASVNRSHSLGQSMSTPQLLRLFLSRPRLLFLLQLVLSDIQRFKLFPLYWRCYCSLSFSFSIYLMRLIFSSSASQIEKLIPSFQSTPPTSCFIISFIDTQSTLSLSRLAYLYTSLIQTQRIITHYSLYIIKRGKSYQYHYTLYLLPRARVIIENSRYYITYLMKLILLALLCIALPLAHTQTACSNIPADHVYYLTSFCDQTTACGKSCGNCNWYYAADSQRFKCGSTISCSRAGKSANLEVIDYGPNCDLEKKSGKPIIDASYSACKLFTGSTSCGWSDKLAVTCVKVGGPSLVGKFPLGECTWDESKTDLPFCHLQQNRGKVTLENVHEWVLVHEMKEMISTIISA